jgi:uncharacterized protein
MNTETSMQSGFVFPNPLEYTRTMNKVLQDRAYSEIYIDDPLVLELIETTPFQRLKKINQYGGVNFVYPTHQVSRFEHSVGVWHVLRTLGADLDVQVAGLLHDIGHTAFSHMVDQALQSKDENYHEQRVSRIKGWEEVKRILEKSGITLRAVDDYPEIKKRLPDVGADRIDYAIRDYIGATGVKTDLGEKVLKNLALVERNIVFLSPEVAKEYALAGLEAMWLVIYDAKVAVIYQALAEMIRQGISQGWILDSDLLGNDEQLLKKFFEHEDRLNEKYLKLFTQPFKVIPGEETDYDFHHVKLKARYFDPSVIVDGEKKVLSSIDKEFLERLKHMVDRFDKRQEGEYFKVVFNG